MLTRRAALGLLAATPMVAALDRRAAARTAQIARDPERHLTWGRVYAGDESAVAPTRGVWLPTTEGYYALIDRPVRTRKPRVFSISNANDRYTVWLEIARHDDRFKFLVLPDGMATHVASWTGGGGGPNAISFVVGAEHAIALAAAWGIVLKHRTPLGTGLVGHWRTRRHLVDRGDPIEIELEVENTGTEPAYLAIGSFARWAKNLGPRDNRYALMASAAWLGHDVHGITAESRGGLGIYETIRPGASFTDEPVDLRAWAVIDRSGVYEVACRFRSVLVGDPRTTGGMPDHGHEAWDVELSGTVLARVE